MSHTPSLCKGLVRTATLRIGGYRTPLGRLLVCGLLGIFLAGWDGSARAEPLSADIPAGPVAAALANFARQTGLQLVYVSDIAKGRMSHGARAGTSAAQALTQLLAGTDLPLSEIAIATGFSDQSHCGRRFRERVGITPSSYRWSRHSGYLAKQITASQ